MCVVVPESASALIWDLNWVENVLRSEGFTQWGEVEFEDTGKREVDDAVAADGRRLDLKLDQSLKIIERKPD